MASSEKHTPGIVLKPGRDGPIRKRHHPWIYSQAVAEVNEGAGLLPIRSAEGAILGWGFYSPASLIAVRMASYTAERPREDWLEERLRAARSLRESLGLDSDGVRLVNAEGDFVPGLIVDRYADTCVVSMHARGLEGEAEGIFSGLRAMFPAGRIYVKRDEHYARVEKLEIESGYVEGTGDGIVAIREGDIQTLVDHEKGQKTGFYLDMRQNRSIISRCCAGKSLLNLFAYTGAVALRAAAAGAARVVSVESSHRALEIARESMKLNPSLQPDALAWIQADVFSYLEHAEAADVVVADPPPFARRRADLEGAIKGYLSLFQGCFRALAPGGFAFFFSCSGAVDRPTFRQVVAEAAVRSGRSVRFLRELHADADHPVAATHPEGEYLKGWMLHAQ